MSCKVSLHTCIHSAFAGIILGLATLVSHTAQAQDWPTRPVKFIVPFGPGSSTDVAARLVADRLQEKWGKAAFIENKPGGDSMVAINAFVGANDDHVIFVSPTSTFVAHPFRIAKLSYDRERDLIPIVQMSSALVGLAVPESLGVGNLREFIDHVRKNPGKLNFAASPSTSEMSMDVFLREQKLTMTKVPYRDVVQAANDLSTDRLHAIFASVTIFQSGMQGKTIRLISITGDTKSDIAPGVIPAREQGYPVLGIEGGIGMFGPPSMSAASRGKLAADVLEVVKRPEISSRLTTIGQVPAAGDAALLAQTIARQHAAFAAMAEALNIKPE